MTTATHFDSIVVAPGVSARRGRVAPLGTARRGDRDRLPAHRNLLLRKLFAAAA